jgi:branched-chain amino acid transport system permease protein
MKVLFLRAAAPLSFDLMESINLVLMVILGGAGTLFGPLIGALVFVALPELLRVADTLRLIVFGALLVLLALFAPRGICGLTQQLWRRAGARKQGAVHA